MSNVNVIKVWFYDWDENYVEGNVWKHWNEWYVVKELIDRAVDAGHNDKPFYEDAVTDWKAYIGLTIDGQVEGFIVNKADDLIMEVWNHMCSEFGVMVFNVDEFKKLNGKVVRIRKDPEEEWDGWEVFEDDGSVEWQGVYVNGEVDESVNGWMIMCDKDFNVFKLVEWTGY